jgi:putative oxidoreductase
MFNLLLGAYYQILPKVAEAAQFDPQMISAVWYPLVLLGSWAEMILPLLILLGLFTRGAALGMIGFIIVQSLTDIFGHGADAATIGGWFDRASDALILDQRLLWVFLLLVLVVQGGGRYALDHWLSIDKSTE